MESINKVPEELMSIFLLAKPEVLGNGWKGERRGGEGKGGRRGKVKSNGEREGGRRQGWE